MIKQRTVKLVCFGLGGDSVEYGGGARCSGYGTPERPHAAANEIIPDGTPVIDKRPAVATEEGHRWVFKGPMCNPDIPDGECDACPAPSDIFARAMVQDGGSFGVLLTLQAAHKATKPTPGPLDFVSVREYVAGWRAVGARIGKYVNGEIVWE